MVALEVMLTAPPSAVALFRTKRRLSSVGVELPSMRIAPPPAPSPSSKVRLRMVVAPTSPP